MCDAHEDAQSCCIGPDKNIFEKNYTSSITVISGKTPTLPG